MEDISRVRGLVTQPLAIRFVQQLDLVKTQDQTSLIRALLRLEQVSSCRAIIIIGESGWSFEKRSL
jgi:hypothetical protein